MESIIFLLIGLIVGLAVMYWSTRPLMRRASEREAQQKIEQDQSTQKIMDLSREVAQSGAQRAALEERLSSQKEELATLSERAHLEFKNLANDILEEKSRQFKQSNKESLELLLKPFKDNIEGFRKRVEEVYVNESQQRFSLKEEIKNLNEMNRLMSQEATNLTNALKGNSKVQGDWGEMILETILDSSNLMKGIHYTTQENIKSEDGLNLRPDVILNLPDNKQIVIDSKVSLTAYVAYTESDSPEITARAVKEHLRSVRSHIDELGAKNYSARLISPDFVIMFIPTEPAFLLALQSDNSLWSDAYNKKVIISSPTNLFALLKIVADLWKRDNQSKNAKEIADAGAALYDKFAGFADTLVDVGKGIENASKNYEKAMSQLKTGRGNLMNRAEKLRELGVKSSKNMPAQLNDYDEQE